MENKCYTKIPKDYIIIESVEDYKIRVKGQNKEKIKETLCKEASRLGANTLINIEEEIGYKANYNDPKRRRKITSIEKIHNISANPVRTSKINETSEVLKNNLKERVLKTKRNRIQLEEARLNKLRTLKLMGILILLSMILMYTQTAYLNKNAYLCILISPILFLLPIFYWNRKIKKIQENLSEYLKISELQEERKRNKESQMFKIPYIIYKVMNLVFVFTLFIPSFIFAFMVEI